MTTKWYRLTNLYNGPTKALDVVPDGSGSLKIADVGNYSGQFWKLVPSDTNSNKYHLRTQYLGDAMSLDIINDGINNTPHLAQTGNYSGQFWALTSWGDDIGTFRLTNDFTGPEKHFDVYSDDPRPVMAENDHSGQHWVITLVKITP